MSATHALYAVIVIAAVLIFLVHTGGLSGSYSVSAQVAPVGGMT